MRTLLLAAALLATTACGRSAVQGEPGDGGDGGQDAGPADAGDAGSDAGPSDAGDGGESDAGAPDGGDGGSVVTVIRVHYPAGSHTLTLRGSAAPLSWTHGSALSPGAADTWSYSVDGLSGPLEFKPLLDDSVWSRGPNYHLVPGDTLELYPHFTSTVGQVVTLLASFHSALLNNDRAVYAYLPPSYGENGAASYPVVYMHDGQNLWAALPQLSFNSTWNVDSAFDAAAESGICSANGEIGWGAQPLGQSPVGCIGDGDCASGSCRTFPEAIVIAPANTAQRIYEYTPTTDPTTAGGGGGDLYLRMLIEELKPQVESALAGRIRTGPSNTALVGSSLGGLISAYAGVQRPDVYGLIGALSPSTWWNNDVLVADVQQSRPAPDRPLRVYVDSGAGTADDESDTDQLAAAYLSLGYIEGTDYRHVVQQGAQHSEVYWAERFPGAMQLLLGER